MASKAIYTVVAVVGIAAASGAAWWYQNKPARPAPEVALAAGSGGGAAAPAGAASGPARAPSVEVARVEEARLADEAQAVGSLRSRQSVMLRPEASGRVTRLNFRDGERVRRGQLLVQLDDQLPMAQVQQAQAELSIARANHKRNQELVGQGFISQRSVDESSANLQVADAKLALAQAQAARLKIVAPFDGITGIRSINVGDYLKDGADIVNLEDLEAIFVDFRLPERFQTKIQRGQQAVVETDALPGRRFGALVLAIDPLVDANGRSVGIRGCIDNRQLQLRPGMFARVTTVFGERPNARVVPEEAIVPQGGRQFVIRLSDGPDPETKLAQRVEVKVGMRSPGRVEITDGLQRGDLIVTAGQQRIQRDGMAVRVVELGQPGGTGRNGNGRGVMPANPTAVAGAAPANGSPEGPVAAAAPAPAPVAPAAPVRAASPILAAPSLGGANPCAVSLADSRSPRPRNP
jgi:membrane fusion protein (multidrug efflux system)